MKQQVAAILEKHSWFKRAFDYYKGFQTAGSKMFFHKVQIAQDNLPIPDPLLLVSTTGSADASGYFQGGLLAQQTILSALTNANVNVSQLERVLDFGCGCGRVLRQWRDFKEVEFHAVDIDSKAVEWCAQNLTFCHAQTCKLAPPLSYPTGFFSFIYALSVLTHLTETQQLEWLREWHRILQPGGYLLFTVHGNYYRPSLTEPERLKYDAHEMVIRNPNSAGTNRCGTYHPPEYVSLHLTQGFHLLRHIPSGALGNPHQDLYLLRKR